MQMRNLLIVVCAAFALSACANTNPRADFSGLGEVDTERDKEVEKRYKKMMESDKTASRDEVKVLEGQLPEGLEARIGELKVAEGYDHEIVGKYSIHAPAPEEKGKMVERIRTLAKAADANAALVNFTTYNGKVRSVDGFIFRMDPDADDSGGESMPEQGGEKGEEFM